MYVDKDVPDDKLVLMEQKIKITKNNKTVSAENREEMMGNLK